MLIRTLAIMFGILSVVCVALALERFVFNKHKDCLFFALCGGIVYTIFLSLIKAPIQLVCLIPLVAFALVAMVAYKYYKVEKQEKKMSKDRFEEFKRECFEARADVQAFQPYM